MQRLGIYSVGFLFAAVLTSLPAHSQSGPQQCTGLNSLADQHSQKAQSLLNSIEADSKGLPPDEIARVVQDRAAQAGSESELAGLARDAYKKCLTDYLAGGAQQPTAVAPIQQAPVQQAVPQQAAPVQQAPVQQQKQQQRVYRQQPQQQQQQPGIIIGPGGLIDLGIGIGIGRSNRDR